MILSLETVRMLGKTATQKLLLVRPEMRKFPRRQEQWLEEQGPAPQIANTAHVSLRGRPHWAPCGPAKGEEPAGYAQRREYPVHLCVSVCSLRRADEKNKEVSSL